jgi:polysaccharide export outer membrane protein
MRPGRLLIVLMLAAAIGGCLRTPVAEPVPVAVAAPLPTLDDQPYTLDSGDRLRVVVFGQDGLTNSYAVAASGHLTLPLIGSVSARGTTTEELARIIAERLKRGYIREPHVAIEVEAYRPFFILGEVTYPGQYPYVPNMTVETAVAIAGGFTPRAFRWEVQIDRPAGPGGRSRGSVPLLTRVRPGDTVIIKERWF